MKTLEQSEDESEDGDGTAKQKRLAQDPAYSNRVSVSGFVAPTDWRGSLSQTRFSNILDGWMRPSSPSGSPKASVEKKIVSEPKLVAQNTGGFSNKGRQDDLSGEEFNLMDYEHMLV